MTLIGRKGDGITVRLCRKDDLPAIEWDGRFTPHRRIIEETFGSQGRGENIMLVAQDAAGFPVGQVWVNVAERREKQVGTLWALRVHPDRQGRGIGTRLVNAAEDVLRRLGCAWAELDVEKDNDAAMRLYQRLGYRIAAANESTTHYTTPDGAPAAMHFDTWLLKKPLEDAYGDGDAARAAWAELGNKVDHW